jgi:hypothetical protein
MSASYNEYQAHKDREYAAACEEHGVDAAPNYAKQFPASVTIPGTILDRGHRVGGPKLVDEGAGDDETVEQQAPDAEDSEIVEAVQKAGELLDRKLVRFVLDGRKSVRIASRLAAICLRSGRIQPKHIYRIFDPKEVTEARLRLASQKLAALLDGDQEGAL